MEHSLFWLMNYSDGALRQVFRVSRWLGHWLLACVARGLTVNSIAPPPLAAMSIASSRQHAIIDIDSLQM
jgi:hypothetical protein